ncbi:polyamine aminopropyltransferase [Bacillus alveayuensis]|jgi:spermidine synthase|uniref:Polyamine aminopropyltransferase n=1 Tax=Aeribacillus alveayuensis TaxID=279215 RepID=A0ABT9VNW9_9BACI|nr:polyamine aminopropyltransferase [Bacillus alveayuensis]MDQ0162669.1 spermidine synthase [Bacillus alveayuensis]
MEKTAQYIQKIGNDLWLTEDERQNLKISYRVKEVLFSKSSPFQHVMILDSYDFGRMLVLDGVVQTTSIDGHIYNEMISHVPLSIHPNPQKVLIIGGGDCGVAREVCKYPNVKEIDMVEIDELVVKACKEYLPEVSGNLSDPRVNFLFIDGVKYAAEKENEYDVIIVDSSDPVGPAEQLFSKEFYVNLHRALKEDGLMVCQSQSPIFHLDVLKQSYSHLASLFPITKLYTAVVPTYPGGMWSFTIGSNKYENIHVSNFSKETKYVNQDILEGCFKLPEFLQNALIDL